MSFVIGHHFFLLGASLSYHAIMVCSMPFLKIARRGGRLPVWHPRGAGMLASGDRDHILSGVFNQF
ncbi:hypothetical protein, partial [uncultured Subdoligranulum sp.]|uniref:hypothetical protein n=1 Tax=uncultured Subdoligranulum sp. TaxID=512298 RepID=UPI00260DBA62